MAKGGEGRPSLYPWGEIRLAVTGKLMTMRQAAEHYGCPYGSIAARSSREGWFKGQDYAPAGKSPAIAKAIAAKQERAKEAEATSIVLAKQTLEELRDSIRTTGAQVVKKGLDHAAEQGGEFIVAKASNVKALVDAGAKATGSAIP